MQVTELLVALDPNGLCVLTLNRPALCNALSPEMILALRKAVDEIAENPHCRCVVLRGAGGSFCSGFDLKARDRARSLLAPGFTAATITALTQLPQPVIAAVHGHCMTGGLELALAADFIVAADDAHFADTHAKWGMRAGWGLTQRLPRRVGIALAKDMMFTGRELSGAEAAAAGLATRCVPSDQFEAAVNDMIALILERSSGALRWIKTQVDGGVHMELGQALQFDLAQRSQDASGTDSKLKQSGWIK
jgi:enoyl-CoA hydratase/carnithine racemase